MGTSVILPTLGNRKSNAVCRLGLPVESRGGAWTLGILVLLLLCVPSSLAANRTFAYVPHINCSKLLELGVDDYVFYLPRNLTSQEDFAARFTELRASGRGVFLVIGQEVNQTTDAVSALGRLSNIVREWEDHVDGFILWDDPLSKGGQVVRNSVARNLSLEFPGEQFGLSLDLPSLSRANLTLLSSGAEEPLGVLNLSYYDFLVAYYYSWIDRSSWDMGLAIEKQGTHDPGITSWLKHAVKGAVVLGQSHDLEVWFMHNAHSSGDNTVTTRQMCDDLQVSKAAGVDRVGWFTFDGSEYFGDPERSAPDGWIRYHFLKCTLVESATQESLVDLSSRLVEYRSQQEENMDLLNDSLSDALRRLGRSLSGVSNALGELSKGLSTSLGDLDSKIDSASVASSRRVEGVLSTLSELNLSLSSNLEDLRKTMVAGQSDLEADLVSLNRSVRGLNDQLVLLEENLSSQVRSLNEALVMHGNVAARSFTDLCAWLAGNFTRLWDALEKHNSSALEMIAEKADELSRMTVLNREAILQVHDEVLHVLQAQDEGLSNLESNSQARHDQIVSTLEILEAEREEDHMNVRDLIYIYFFVSIALGGVSVLLATASLAGRRRSA